MMLPPRWRFVLRHLREVRHLVTEGRKANREVGIPFASVCATSGAMLVPLRSIEAIHLIRVQKRLDLADLRIDILLRSAAEPLAADRIDLAGGGIDAS